MKLNTHFVMCALALLCFSLGNTVQAQLKTQAVIGLEFGGQNCNKDGHGICNFYVAGKSDKIYSIQKVDEYTFKVFIPIKSLSEQQQKSVAGKAIQELSQVPKVFTQDEDVVISEEVLRMIGLNPKYNLFKAGQYLTEVQGENMVFPIRVIKLHF